LGKVITLPFPIGGEEFAIVLSCAAESNALLAVERVLAAVRAEAVRISNGRAISVTCSAGLASFAVEIDDSASLLKRAARALCLAKNAGRDRVVARH
jgi:diguanylate cyclase (GGDEF)-like protein